MNTSPKIDTLPRLLTYTSIILLCLITLAAAVGVIKAPSYTIPLDTYFYDQFMKSASPPPLPSQVTIVDIDDTSLSAVGQWPWPRYRVARLLAVLAENQPNTLGIDIVFPEPDRLSLGHVTQQFKKDFQLDINFTNVPPSLTDNDGFFGHILGQTRTVGARYYYFDHLSKNEVCKQFPFSIAKTDSRLTLPRARGVLCNTPKIETRLTAGGFINNQYDTDGLLRRTPLLIQYQGAVFPHLSLAMFMAAKDINSLEIGKNKMGFFIQAGPHTIPITQEGYAHMGFTGPAPGHRYISAVDILNQNFSRSDIQDKIVLVGSSAVGLNDIHPMVFDPHFPGIEISAVLLDNMNNNTFIVKPTWGPISLALACLAFGLFMGGLFLKNPGPMILGTATLVWTGLILGTSFLIYFQWGVFISPATPLVLGFLIFSLLSFARFTAEKKAAFNWFRQLSAAQQLTMETMVSMVETRDPETGEHIVRTQHYARAVAERLREKGLFLDLLTDHFIETLFLSAPLHDIGKVGIPDNILLKPARLDEDEFRHMKMHATYGRRILRKAGEKIQGSNYLAMGGDIAGTHHEKWNGQGYPQGLSGKDIPLAGRVMAIADVYDALISQRCYKPSFPHEKAMSIILEEKGKLFDPVIVEAFVDIESTIQEIAKKFSD